MMSHKVPAALQLVSKQAMHKNQDNQPFIYNQHLDILWNLLMGALQSLSRHMYHLPLVTRIHKIKDTCSNLEQIMSAVILQE